MNTLIASHNNSFTPFINYFFIFYGRPEAANQADSQISCLLYVVSNRDAKNFPIRFSTYLTGKGSGRAIFTSEVSTAEAENSLSHDRSFLISQQNARYVHILQHFYAARSYLAGVLFSIPLFPILFPTSNKFVRVYINI